ncbi:MAG TPA: retropepsin-like aspartic protease [Rhizomicrobium sp.]|nr:retropepsin-like aspartic protease [Rhizomicrobium sp.]
MTSHTARTLIACTLTSVFLTSTAFADECGPLKIFASVDLRMATDDRAAFVPVTLQGQTKYMLLDTGGTVSEITGSTVASLGLESHKTPTLRFYDVKGNYVDHATIVPDFAIGDLKGNNVDFVVGPDDLFPTNENIAGILGPGILRFYDVAIDFADRKLTLLSQDHCEGKVIYWKADTVAAVPMQVVRASGHIVVSVVLDGHKLNAMIDTGATNSVLNLSVAEGDFGLKPRSPDMPAIEALGDRDNSFVYQHTFKSLGFEGIGVTNPVLDIIPDLAGSQMEQSAPIGTRFKDPSTEDATPDMLIGMDILRHFHMYIAYKEQKLYITPASTPVAVAAGATPASPASSTPAKAAGSH